MSGSRLGRGRGGRLALYGGCGVLVVLLVFLYRAATMEMARLRDHHIQCVHQQEALAAQLQVIFEYKVRLEKSLAEEKGSNAALKLELQQRASREKSLRDKDGREAMQRFESLQQTYKILQSENQDLQEECKKHETQALEDMNKLEGTLQKLRTHIKEVKEEKETEKKALESLKNKYLEVENEKTRLEEKYNELVKNQGNTNSTIEHLKKEVFQLNRELDEVKKGSNYHQRMDQRWSVADSPQLQQVSPANNNNDKNPEPLHAPLNHHAIGDPLPINEDANENRIRFAQKNGNIVPVGANDDSLPLPLPYDLRNRVENDGLVPSQDGKLNENEDEQLRQVIPPPNQNNERLEEKKSSSSNVPNLESPLIDKNLNRNDYPQGQAEKALDANMVPDH